jgi:hypothetical protein
MPPIMLLNQRWRNQPAIVKKPENSSLRRSKRWVSLQLEQILLMNEGKLGSRSAVIALIG